MTPEERAVIQAAERVVCVGDDDAIPSAKFTKALEELERAVNAHDRVAEPYWWEGDSPSCDSPTYTRTIRAIEDEADMFDGHGHAASDCPDQ